MRRRAGLSQLLKGAASQLCAVGRRARFSFPEGVVDVAGLDYQHCFLVLREVGP